MVCIYCHGDTRVTNSRLQKQANQVWRRRQCIECGNNFTTHEIADSRTAIIVRYSPKVLKPFSRDTLFISVYESCKHRAQAVSDASALTQTILAKLYDHLDDSVLERDTIAAVTLAVLGRFDSSAATMYSAYHPASHK
jgi:transcriptional repressor NrdR